MKKLTLLATLVQIALIALVMTGCVQLHSDTVITEDGSGTASLTLSMSPDMKDVLKDMKDMDMGQGEDVEIPMFDDISKDDLAQAAKGHGVTIKKFEKGLVDGRDQIDIVMEFEDLEGLSYVMSSIMGGATGDGMGIFETADGNFILKDAHYDFKADPAAEAAEKAAEAKKAEKDADAAAMTDEEKSQKQMEIMGKMMGAMAELDIRLTLTVPGEVIESNAPTVEGKTSIWSINAGNMMQQQGQNMDPVIKFSSKGLKIKALKSEE